jgi:glycosyltransferase involved in cell wall biosynthesis
MPRVLVNAMSAQLGGGSTHVLAQMEELDRLADFDLTIHAVGEVAVELTRRCQRAQVVCHPRWSLPLRVAWEQCVLAAAARSHDVIYCPGNFALLASPRPQVVCAQNAFYFTDEVRALRRRLWPTVGRARLTLESVGARVSMRRADRAVTVSNAMRDAVLADMGHATALSVIRSAAPVLPKPTVGTSDPPAGSYLLSVAHDDPHKDWDGLVAGVLSDPALGTLVLVGRCTAARAQALTKCYGGRVRALGAVHDRARLSALYTGARCVITHSWIESFGLTLAEAQVAGVPAAASDLPAHREIALPTTRFYAPGDTSALAAAVRAAMDQVPVNPGEAPRTWHDNAAELAAVLREVAAGS